MKLSKKSGLTLAAAAAALIAGGAMVAPTSAVAGAKGKCFGVNSCKGNSAYKGQIFLELTKAECSKKGGKFKS